jgi:uncharacterized membrane protein YkvA (DUF1232 family)
MKTFSLESLYQWYRDLIRNPKYRIWVIIASLAYLFSPFDISPDIFPVIGWIDDGIVLTLLVSEVSQILAEKVKSRNPQTTTTTEVNQNNNFTTVEVESNHKSS